jgi:hypothetical protein
MDILKKNRTYTIDLKDILIVDIRPFGNSSLLDSFISDCALKNECSDGV